jgi:DNA repair exonuclease SbcCD ATPase subunit
MNNYNEAINNQQANEIVTLRALIGGDITEWLKEDETIIQRLERERKDLCGTLSLLAKERAEIARLKAQAALDESLLAESTRTIQELEAHINDLRETLEKYEDLINYQYTGSSEAISALQDASNLAEKILAKTSAQSLQAHDDEVIERCAKVCDKCRTTIGAGHFIRALKGKQNETT